MCTIYNPAVYWGVMEIKKSEPTKKSFDLKRIVEEQKIIRT